MAGQVMYGIRWSTGHVWRPDRLPLTTADLVTIMHTAPDEPADGEMVYSTDAGETWRSVGSDPDATARFLCGYLAGWLSQEGLPIELGEDVLSSFVVIDKGHRIRVTVAPC
jgi:hypothetical protein